MQDIFTIKIMNVSNIVIITYKMVLKHVLHQIVVQHNKYLQWILIIIEFVVIIVHQLDKIDIYHIISMINSMELVNVLHLVHQNSKIYQEVIYIMIACIILI